ncbi:hypothetical protein HWD35_05850 [Tsukamurella tyrosinosolvens]|uniref:hypothetical protein n=1 Tax=Tsukamurella tyrosinosolvens TaxID=57704 RepID=UPI001CE0B27B|nr:hypothetical protein [Tsukamurella tyrosinosolvens]MCA4994230.1 hypothetical protein [Tsukamurella tyrosinosolvens]
MSKTGRINQRRGERGIPKSRQPRHITVRSVRRDQPDLRKLARAIIAQALSEANSDQREAADSTLEQEARADAPEQPTTATRRSAEVPHD